MRRSAEADDFTHAWLNVAALELNRGDTAADEDALDRAMRLGWQQPAISFPAAVLYAELGRQDAAVEALAQALLIAPDLADDPYWASNTEIAGLRDAAIDHALESAHPSTAPLIAMFAGRTADALAYAAELPDPEGQITRLAIQAWANEDGAAQQALIDMAEANPLDTRPVVWSSLLAARDGDDAAQLRFRRWAGLVGGSLGTAIGQDTVVTDEPYNRRQVAGPNANFHGIYAYRRLYPWDLLVPGVPKLTLE
jgi:hypothetical protein